MLQLLKCPGYTIVVTIVHHRIAALFLLLQTKRHGNVPTGSTLPLPQRERRMQVHGARKLAIPDQFWLHRVLSTLRPARCYQHGAAGRWQVVALDR